MKVGDTINANETMTSLQIAEITGKLHKNVLMDIRTLIGQGVGELNFKPSSYRSEQNKELPMYELTKKGCLILASGYDALLRERIIDRWEQLEIEKAQQFQIPQTLSQALLLASQQAEQIEQQQKLIEEQKPKAEFFDAVMDSKDTIDMEVVAKTLNMGIGRNNLFEFLRDNNILMQNNRPYQKYVDLGWFRTLESSYQKPNGDTCIYIKTVVFQQGLNGIRKLLEKNGYKQKDAPQLF